MEDKLIPVNWYTAVEGRAVLARLREGGPLHEGMILKRGRRTIRGLERCLLLIGERKVRRDYETFFYTPKKTATLVPKWNGR